MNLLPFRNLYKALRGFSLTFACVFAFAILGLSIHALLRSMVGVLPIKGIFLWLIPVIIIMILAKLEPRLIPDAQLRRKWSGIIVIGALILVVAINGIRLRFFSAATEPATTDQVTTEPIKERPSPRGPRSK
jgi:hypothetical protein